MYIQAGGDEALLDDARLLAERRSDAGVDVRLDIFPGMQHTFQMAAGRAPEADDAIRRMADWVRPRLGRTAPQLRHANDGAEKVSDAGASRHVDDFASEAEPLRHELMAYCYRMLGSVEEAEDLVQETYLRAWRSYAQFEGRSSMRRWLYRIATNVCLTELKQRRRRVLPSGLGSPSDEPDAPPASAAGRGLAAADPGCPGGAGVRGTC